MSSALTAHKGQPLQACLHAAVFLCAGGHSTNARDRAAAEQVHGERRTGKRSAPNARDFAGAKRLRRERRTGKRNAPNARDRAAAEQVHGERRTILMDMKGIHYEANIKTRSMD